MPRQSQVKLRCVSQNEGSSGSFIVIADHEPACILSINRVHGDLIALTALCVNVQRTRFSHSAISACACARLMVGINCLSILQVAAHSS
jgi:hypothetical protein